MGNKEEIEAFHKEMEAKYLNKETDKGIVEKVEYLTFLGATGGTYHDRPQLGKKGLVVCRIGNKSYPAGELQFK
jgi:hypothetical protein